TAAAPADGADRSRYPALRRRASRPAGLRRPRMRAGLSLAASRSQSSLLRVDLALQQRESHQHCFELIVIVVCAERGAAVLDGVQLDLERAALREQRRDLWIAARGARCAEARH